MALSTPNSDTRSRTDWAMVLPATSRMVKKTAVRMETTMAPMFPTCSAKPLTKAFSVSVFVSAGELANCWSMLRAIDSAFLGSLILM